MNAIVGTRAHYVWSTLYRRQREIVSGRAYDGYVEALTALELPVDAPPSLEAISRSLAMLCGWRVQPVSGFLAEARFFSLLAQRVFPCNARLRSAGEIEFTSEPDLFHDVVGHLPMLLDATLAKALERFGRLGLVASRTGIEALGRLYWRTIETGLLSGEDRPRALGAAILSSRSELGSAFSDTVEQRPFDVAEVMASPFCYSTTQATLYVLESTDQIEEALEALSKSF